MIPTPAACAACGCANETSSPSIRIVPRSGWCTPASTFISVDLPAPFSPTTAWISPASQSRLTPCSTSTPRKLLRMSRICSSGAMARSDLHPAAGLGGREHGVDDAGAARAVGEQRQPLGRRAGDRGVAVGDEQVEAVEVALRVAGGREREPRGVGGERRRVAVDGLDGVPAAEPERLRLLLLEAHAGFGARDLDVQVVLAAGRDLADDQGPRGAALRPEERRDRVLGADGAAGAAVVRAGLEGAR